jgi:hypothetical protein
MQVRTPSAAVNARVRQSSERDEDAVVLRREEPTMKRLSAARRRQRQIAAISRLSAFAGARCGARRADRQADGVSRSRAVARASIRFARFAHAISRTSPVVASSSQAAIHLASQLQIGAGRIAPANSR